MAQKRLLIVDDLPERAEMVRATAVALGYDVMLTRHGTEFKRVFEAFDPTDVMLEVILPDIDGIELIQWLQDRRCGARVLVTSASRTEFDYAELAQKIGVAGGLNVAIIANPLRNGTLHAALA